MGQVLHRNWASAGKEGGPASLPLWRQWKNKLSRIYCNVKKCCNVVSATKTNEDRGGMASGGR